MFIQEDSFRLHNFYNKLKYIKLIWPQHLNYILVYKFSFLNPKHLSKLSQINLFRQVSASQNKDRKECYLGIHLQICMLQKQHAYLFLSQIWFLFEMIEGMNVLRHISHISFRFNHSILSQSIYISTCNLGVDQLQGIYFIFFSHD